MFKFLPDSEFVALWLSKWLELKTSLGRDPEDSFAWRWALRLKVLAFMMTRYGRLALPAATADQILPPPFVVLPTSSKLVQSGQSIRRALIRITEQNKYKLRLDEI